MAMRSMSARARDQILNPGKCAFRFIGNDARKVEKPECISPQIERQRVRAARSAGSNPAAGLVSLRYSAIARVSQILTPSCVRQGTRIEGESRRISARASGSSGEIRTSSTLRPLNLTSNQPRSDQEE